MPPKVVTRSQARAAVGSDTEPPNYGGTKKSTKRGGKKPAAGVKKQQARGGRKKAVTGTTLEPPGRGDMTTSARRGGRTPKEEKEYMEMLLKLPEIPWWALPSEDSNSRLGLLTKLLFQ